MFQDIEWMNMEFLERDMDTEKGDNGRVAVVGGCDDYPSTPAIVGLGAIRTGVDLVEIVAPEKSSEIACGHHPEFTRTFIGEANLVKSEEAVIESVEEADCAVIGNGAGNDEETRKFFLSVIGNTETPLVIDADMLVPDLRDIDFSGRKVILTPHSGEFERLYEEPLEEIGAIKEQVKKAARIYRATVVLKGRYDVISDGESVFVNKTGTPYLSKGGTGDLLAGIISGLLPLTRTVKAGFLACYINGLGGERSFEKNGPGFTLEELGREVSIELAEIL